MDYDLSWTVLYISYEMGQGKLLNSVRHGRRAVRV